MAPDSFGCLLVEGDALIASTTSLCGVDHRVSEVGALFNRPQRLLHELRPLDSYLVVRHQCADGADCDLRARLVAAREYPPGLHQDDVRDLRRVLGIHVPQSLKGSGVLGIVVVNQQADDHIRVQADHSPWAPSAIARSISSKVITGPP